MPELPVEKVGGDRYTKKRNGKMPLRFFVIPLGFEPKTHALEGRCSNPTELRNQTDCKSTKKN